MSFDKYLHLRIQSKCLPLFNDKHYPQCAFEAMKQVELALKDKMPYSTKLFGRRLIENLLGKGESIKFIIPIDENMRNEAKLLFDAAFAYYRNYTAHDGNKIKEIHCFRILILASELLDLIGASLISFAEIGGVKGLINNGLFSSKQQLCSLLEFLLNQTMIDEVYDGFFEEMALSNFTEEQQLSVIELGLIEFKTKIIEESLNNTGQYVELSWFELTELGKEILYKKE